MYRGVTNCRANDCRITSKQYIGFAMASVSVYGTQLPLSVPLMIKALRLTPQVYRLVKGGSVPVIGLYQKAG